MTEYTVKQLIENHPKAFRPDAAVGVEAVIQYILTGDQAGNYIITIKDGACSVAEGMAENPSMTLTCDAMEFHDILLGRVDGMMAFMQGRLKMAGDLNLALKLTSFFKMN